MRKFAIVAALAMSSLACRTEVTRARDAARALAQALMDKTPKSPTRRAGRPVARGAVLYVDASRSMAGFGGCNERQTDYDLILDRLATELSIVAVYRFGEEVRGSGNAFERRVLARELHCPTFYDRMQNPDYELYHRLNRDSTGTTSIYVTDGVQSDLLGANQSPSVRELEDWIRADRALAILAFQSTFSGQAWSEQRQQMIATVTGTKRPYYAFVFAKTESDLEALLRRLSRETLAKATLLRVTSDSVQCSAVPASKLPKYATAATLPWAMIDAYTYKSLQALPSVVAEYRCVVPTSFPFEAVLPRIEESRYLAWEGGEFIVQKGLPGGAVFSTDSVAVRKDGNTAFLKATLPFDEKHRFGHYELHISASAGALRRSVRDLTTDSDAAVSDFDRTYRFGWLVEKLARARFEQRPAWSPFALTVQYR